MTILSDDVAAKRVSQKVKLSVRACLMLVFAWFNVSLIRCITLRVQIQRLFRTTAAENHEIIGVVHDSGSEHLTRPVIANTQKTVHIQVASSGLIIRPAVCTGAVFATAHLSDSRLHPAFRRNFRPHLNQTQHIPIHNSASDTLHQFEV